VREYFNIDDIQPFKEYLNNNNDNYNYDKQLSLIDDNEYIGKAKFPVEIHTNNNNFTDKPNHYAKEFEYNCYPQENCSFSNSYPNNKIKKITGDIMISSYYPPNINENAYTLNQKRLNSNSSDSFLYEKVDKKFNEKSNNENSKHNSSSSNKNNNKSNSKYIFYLKKGGNNSNQIQLKEDKLSPPSSRDYNANPKKPANHNQKKTACTCKQTKCLKLYCECFASGNYCKNCSCVCCNNLPQFEVERSISIKQAKVKNKHAFKPKVETSSEKHSKGCKCVQSNCLKNYCECFQNGISCCKDCKCRNCRNLSQPEEEQPPVNAPTFESNKLFDLKLLSKQEEETYDNSKNTKVQDY